MDYARRSWQRLGHLRVLCCLTDATNGISLQGLTARFEDTVTTLHTIPDALDERVMQYLGIHRTNRYPRKHGTATRIELQDLYLSDPRLLSQSGAITGDSEAAGYRHAVYVEIPTWAERLRLVRKENYTLTDRGKVLLCLRHTNGANVKAFNPASNPYLLTPGERYFYLYALLDVDGDLLESILQVLSKTGVPFQRGQVGSIAADALQVLSKDRLSRIVSGPNKILKDKIATTVSSVRNQKGSGMGPRESLATPRTEPLVDCGVFLRVDKAIYTYEMTEAGQSLSCDLVQSASIDDFLRSHLAKCAIQLSSSPLPPPATPQQIARYMVESYSLLKSGIGYCSIREVALLAVALGIEDGYWYFEVSDVEEALAHAARIYGKAVRFTKSRRGNLAQVRLTSRFLSEFTDA